MKRGKSQVSMEFLLVVLFAFAITVPMILYFVDESQKAAEGVNIAQITQIARTIASNAETVYAFGEPTTLTIRVYMPKGVDTVNLNNNQLEFVVQNKGELMTISEPVAMNLSGNISNHPGVHRIKLLAANNSVVISEVSI